MKKKFPVKLVSLIGLLLSSCSFLDYIFPPKVESVTISGKRNEILVGEEFQVSAKISPDNAKNKEIIWKSSEDNVASIADGKVSTFKVGSTIIEAISAENSSIKDSFESPAVSLLISIPLPALIIDFEIDAITFLLS